MKSGSTGAARDGSPRLWVLMGWLAFCAIHLALSLPNLDSPGLYYDEAIHAGPAVEFLEGAPRGPHLPGYEAIQLFGRPFPWKTLGYLGALKSHFLIPVFALFGATVEVLRATTITWALIGLGLAMLWIERAFGWRIALLTGALLSTDPSFLYPVRQDWGPNALPFLFRAAGLLLATHGWKERRGGFLVSAGFVFGLAVTTKVDASFLLMAVTIGLILSQPLELWRGARSRRGSLIGATLAFLLGAAPALGFVMTAPGALQRGAAGFDAGAKWCTIAHTLDGSYIHRLMTVGGRFDLFCDAADSPAAWLGVTFAASVCLLLVRWREPGVRFALATALAILGIVFAMPPANRVHHVLLALPFIHLVIALGLDTATRVLPGLGRSLAAGAMALVLVAANLHVALATASLIERTGGRGWWSGALAELATELGPDDTVVSVDWGFHESLLFYTGAPRLEDSVPGLFDAQRSGFEFTRTGSVRDIYLVHDRGYSRLPFGPKLLQLANRLGPERASIRPHLDKQGRPAFYSIRFAAPHRIAYDGQFRLELPAIVR